MEVTNGGMCGFSSSGIHCHDLRKRWMWKKKTRSVVRRTTTTTLLSQWVKRRFSGSIRLAEGTLALIPLSFTHVTHFSLLFLIVLGISKLSQSRVIPRVQESQFAILVSTAPLRKAMSLALQVELDTGHHWANQLILNRWKWQWQDQCCRVSVTRG